MYSETKTCQNCKTDFEILPEDFTFYEKIQVPAPTFCPECRLIRRLVWRNVRSLYKRTCGMCQKSLVAMYKDDGVPVYCLECWNGDDWNPIEYGVDYDFSRSFFEQFKSQLHCIPRVYKGYAGFLTNSEYTNYTANNKNTYLAYSIVYSEDVAYGENIDYTKNSLDCFNVKNLDSCYQNIDAEENYNSIFCVQSNNNIDALFLYDCNNCTNCCLSTNLRNAQYVFKNQQLTKDEYHQAVTDLRLHTRVGFSTIEKLFQKMIQDEAVHKYAVVHSVQNTTGDYAYHVNNGNKVFNVYESENISYGLRLIQVRDSIDTTGCLDAELLYETTSTSLHAYHNKFCILVMESRDCEYSFLCNNCADCFGCIGMINAQYCILNKQYTKEEYEELLSKIKQHMMDMPYIDTKGRVYRYGEFFPLELSPFGYNETNAHDFFPLTKEQIEERGYIWHEKEPSPHQATVSLEDIPEDIQDVSDVILQEIIPCQNEGDSQKQCTTAFRITADELNFYRIKNIPIPHQCPNCRHYNRLQYRNQTPRLYERQCMCDRGGHEHNQQCRNIFQTTYDPVNPAMVYCESCYQKEVL